MHPIEELLGLVDRLDNLVFDAKAVPLSDHVRVDKEVVYDLLDEMRVVLGEARRDLGPAPVAEAGPEAPDDLPAISADEAARTLLDLLPRVRFGGEAYAIEIGGTPMAELRPPREA